VWLRVRILNSLVFSFSTTVCAIRDSLHEAPHVCSAGAGLWLRGGSILTEGIRFEETDQPSFAGGHQGDKKKVFGDGREAVN
jgi:hypothetical protein